MNIGKRNISFGWIWILVGITVGAILSMWSFNGPLISPLGDYTSLPRRLIRLSHIAFIALAMINILYGYQIDKKKHAKLGSLCMIIGAILMPLLLIGAAFFEPFKYATMIPFVFIVIALIVIIKK